MNSAESQVFHQSYVLHSRPYRETSVIVDLLHADGRVSCVAKGVRGKRKSAQLLRATLQPFQSLACAWIGRSDLKTLTKFETSGAASNLKGEALLSGFYLNELLCKVYHGSSESEGVYQIYHQAVQSLAEASQAAADVKLAAVELELRHFEFMLLEKLGYGVNFITDSQSGEAIQADATCYRYAQESGFILQNNTSTGPWPKSSAESAHLQNSSKSLVLSGESILAIRESLSSRQWDNKNTLRDAKRLSRLAFQPLLDGKTIETRRLFQ